MTAQNPRSPNAKSTSAKSTDTKSINTRSTVAPLRILLIEDDEGDRDLALEYLEGDRRRLYITTWARSLEEGIERLETDTFDAVILDLVLPDSKGVTTVSKLCARSGGVPVIVSSYFDEDALASKVIELGAQDYLAKDVMSSQRLGRIISRALARAKHQANVLSQQRLSQQRLSQQRLSQQQNISALADSPPDPLSTKIEQLQTDMQRLESIANHVTNAYENHQSVDDVRQQMVKTLSHECRSPATVILLATNILKSYSTSVEDEQYLTALTRIDEAVKQMMKLLNNAMSFQQVQSITSATPIEIVNLERICEGIIDQLRTTIVPAPVFQAQFIGNCQRVSIYKVVVEQIIRQLLTNAAQYSSFTDDSTTNALTTGTIEITIQNSREQLLIVIADQGRGILAEERSHVFEAFYRSTRTEDTHGIGLGLTIVKTCVEICSGQIDVESQPDKGTTVTVKIPLALASPS